MNTNGKQTISTKSFIVCIMVGISVSVILWFTLLNRNPSRVRGFLTPGWTIIGMINGDFNTIKEVVLNIGLFIPFGVSLAFFKMINLKHLLFCGIITSIFVEVFQYISMLGYAEIDDVIYNTLGAFIGYLMIRILRLSRVDSYNMRNVLFIIVITIVVASSLARISYLTYKSYLHSYYVKIAALNDLDENTPNLLVLNGNQGKVNGTNIYIDYTDDGSICINGSSKIRKWYTISEFSLPAGTYEFSGMSGVEENTVALELESYNSDEGRFMRFTPDIGPIDSYNFTITDNTEFIAYIGIYECQDVNVICTPVLYEMK